MVSINLPSPHGCVVPTTRQTTEIDVTDGDTASRLIGRAGKLGRRSGNSGLAISRRPSI